MIRTIITFALCTLLTACKLDFALNADGTPYNPGGGGGTPPPPGPTPPPSSGFIISSYNGGIDFLDLLGTAVGTSCTLIPSGDIQDIVTLTNITATNITATTVSSQFTSTDGSCTGTETLLMTVVVDNTHYGTTAALGWSASPPPPLLDGSGNMPVSVIATKIMSTYTTVIDHDPTDGFFPLLPQGTQLPVVYYIDDTTATALPYFGDTSAGVDAQGFANAVLMN